MQNVWNRSTLITTFDTKYLNIWSLSVFKISKNRTLKNKFIIKEKTGVRMVIESAWCVII